MHENWLHSDMLHFSCINKQPTQLVDEKRLYLKSKVYSHIGFT